MLSPCRVLLGSTIALLALFCCGQNRIAGAEVHSTDAAAALRRANFDGKWSGRLKCLYDPRMWPDDECDVDFTFVVQDTRMQVEQSIRSKKGEVSTTTLAPLRFKRLATNAVAYSINTGDDEDGTWVETVSFTMTFRDPDHLIVHWTRVVNNIDVPIAKKGSKFSSVGMGEMVRSR